MQKRIAWLVVVWSMFAGEAVSQYQFLPLQTHDFGVVDNWANNPAEFGLVNTGNMPLAILKLTGSKNILAEYPRSYIQPGDTGRIVLRYYTPVIGNISETVEVSLSASPLPEKLFLKGKIRSISENALTACPNEQVQGTLPVFEQSFLVRDVDTDQPVPTARLYLQGQFLSDEFTTPSNGRAVEKTYRSGIYRVNIHAQDYRPMDTSITILAGKKTFDFYMKKEDEIPVVGIETQESVPSPTGEFVQETIPVFVPVDTLVGDNPEFPYSRFRQNNIVFVLDVSGSMRIMSRMDMLKEAMVKLVRVLRTRDRISIITFTSAPVVRLQGISGTEKDTLQTVIRSMVAAGSTNGVKGLRQAYELAQRNFIPDGNNLVIIGTDGAFAQVDENGENITVMVEQYLGKQIKLGVMAFGRDDAALKNMEKMAQKGRGGYMRMENIDSSPELLLEQIRKQSER